MNNIWSKRSNGFMNDLMKAAKFELQKPILQSEKAENTPKLDIIDSTLNKVSFVEKDNTKEYREINNIKIDNEDLSKPCSSEKPNLFTKSNERSQTLEKQIYSENVSNVVPHTSKKRKMDDTMKETCIKDIKRCKGDINTEIWKEESLIENEELSESEYEYEDKVLTMSSFFQILDIPGVSCQKKDNFKEISNDEFLENDNNIEDSVKTTYEHSFLYNEEEAKEPPDTMKVDIISKRFIREYSEFSKNELTFSNKIIPFEENEAMKGKSELIFEIKRSPKSLTEIEESPRINDIFKIEDLLGVFNTESSKHHKRLEEIVLKCYECHICFEEFKYSKVLLQHIESHGVNKYQCVKCDFCSIDVLEFYRHRSIHTHTKPFTCNLCNYETVLTEELTEHVLLHYDKTYECNMCYFTSGIKKELDEHIKTHDKEIDLEEHRILIDDSLHFQENILWQFSNSPYKSVQFSGSLKDDASNHQSYPLTEGSQAPNTIIPKNGSCRLTPIKNETPNNIIRPCIQNSLHNISCDLCDYKCNKKSHLDMHMISHNADRKYKCTLCAYSCRQKQNLNRHMEKHLYEKYLKCTECDYKSLKTYNFQRHLATHTTNINEKSYKCKTSYSRGHEIYFKKPLVITNGSNKDQFETLFRCKECSLVCNTDSDLILHRLIHDKYFRCNECNYKSNVKKDIVKHLQKHSNQYKASNYGYKCSNCEYTSYKKTELDTHLLIHNIVKKHKCNQCNFTSHKSTDLKRHMMVHTGEKPFKCTQCDYATSRSHSLRMHQTLRHSAKMYTCSKCESESKSAKDLKLHQKTCFKETPFKCLHCNYICNKKADLNLHLNVHKKLFKCNLCEFNCTHNSELKIHMYKIHPRKVSNSLLRKSKFKKFKSKKKKKTRNNTNK